MIPIQDLLHRIRWDPEFRRGEFHIGYIDRIEDRILVVPLQRLNFPHETPYAFEIADSEGTIHHIPFHRIRRVYRNGILIWERKSSGGEDS